MLFESKCIGLVKSARDFRKFHFIPHVVLFLALTPNLSSAKVATVRRAPIHGMTICAALRAMSALMSVIGSQAAIRLMVR